MPVRHAGLKWMGRLSIGLMLMLSIPPCRAVEWGYVFIPAEDAQAQIVINQAFAQGLQPEGQPSGHNGIDFWNYLARPSTNPLFIMAYRNWQAVQDSSDEVLNGVLFELALDDHFFDARRVLDRFIAMTRGDVNADVRRLAMSVQRRWTEQNEPVSGITGFQGAGIPHTSINTAWVVRRGNLQAGATNAAYQAPTTSVQNNPNALFEPTLAYERLNPNVETVRPNGWQHALAVLACRALGPSTFRSPYAAAAEGTCQHPQLMSAEAFNREHAVGLFSSWVVLLWD
jgi:hypothetical protein